MKPNEQPALRKQFIEGIEGMLKRPLEEQELKAVNHFDIEVVKTLVNDYDFEEIVTMLRDICGGTSPVQLFEDLSLSPASLEQGRTKLIKYHEGQARDAVRTFDFDEMTRRDPNVPSGVVTNGLRIIDPRLSASCGGYKILLHNEKGSVIPPPA